MQTQIHPETAIGVVSLNVREMSQSINFYVDVLGFQIHSQRGNQAALGAGEQDLLILNEVTDAIRYPGMTGLYHLAILVPSRRQLGLNLRQLAESRTPVQGFADHWVSEAIYLSDPDGNGIEIYRDRPRDEWPRIDGQLQMSTETLDIAGIMDELDHQEVSWSGLPPATKIGHVHLQVADIAAADAFYTGVLGFDLVMHYGGAAGFVSAGGYHHHVGYNTWSSLGATQAPANAIGLAWFSIELPAQTALEEVQTRINDADWPSESTDDGIYLRDSSSNGIILRVKKMAIYPLANRPLINN
ncbi:MAG TPA: VOC family protein [Patescibacteria group bacterium]|nr:VOC family protein [Patescibacteria group bacterium]